MPAPSARPGFLSALPDDPGVLRVAAAFERGNYALVREDAAEQLAKGPEDEVRVALEELVARTEPDPLFKYLLGLTFGLLVVVTLFAYAVGHS